ncbi:hypothetical protein ACVGW4_01155, partial [Enterobacter hormaechei]
CFFYIIIMVGWVAMEDGFRLVRSGVGGMAGPVRVFAFYNLTHVVWATGGGLVPLFVMAKYLDKGNY